MGGKGKLAGGLKMFVFLKQIIIIKDNKILQAYTMPNKGKVQVVTVHLWCIRQIADSANSKCVCTTVTLFPNTKTEGKKINKCVPSPILTLG